MIAPNTKTRFWECLGTVVISSLLASVLLRLWTTNLRVPFDYHGDAAFFGMVVKAVSEEGWYLTNPHLGAPGILEMHDFPMADAFHLLVIKGMGLFTDDWALLFNLYFLLGFPLIALSAVAVFRHLGVSFPSALTAGLLYAFTASRLLKGEGHLFIDVFYQVPAAMLVALWVGSESPPFFAPPSRAAALLAVAAADEAATAVRRTRADWRSLVAAGICVVTAAMGIYYAFFAGVLILFAGARASIRHRTPRNALAGMLLVSAIVAVLGVQLVPTYLYHLRHGPNPQLAARQPHEAEISGAEVAQLLLPVYGHRIPMLQRLTERARATSIVGRGEGVSTSLGIVGGAGFLVLLGVSLLGARAREGHARQLELVRLLAALNLFAVLLATIGGLGYLFALLVTPMIRAYSRMSVVIAFLSLFAVALLLDLVSAHRKRRAWILAAAVTCIGLFDQVTPVSVRRQGRVIAEYASDDAFVKAIETAVPRGSMILELPHQRFPESGGDQVGDRRMVDYDPLRLYFHSRSLRWSYASMYNRPTDAWLDDLSGADPARLVSLATAAGFEGIVIDRYGYPDNGAGLERDLGAACVASPAAPVGAPADVAAIAPLRFWSSEGRLAFFSLGACNARERAELPVAERARRRATALQTLVLRWMEGFWGPERDGGGAFHWCPGTCDLEIVNPAPASQVGSLRMELSAAQPSPSSSPSSSSPLIIDGDLVSEAIALPASGYSFVRRIIVPPGRHVLHLRSDAAPAHAPGDPRRLVWRAQNVSLETLAGKR